MTGDDITKMLWGDFTFLRIPRVRASEKFRFRFDRDLDYHIVFFEVWNAIPLKTWIKIGLYTFELSVERYPGKN